MAEIKIDGNIMQGIVTKAIMEGLGDDQRDMLVQQALQYLITAPRNTYGVQGKTPLQEAFNNAVGVAANRIVLDLMNDGPLVERIKAEVTKAVGEVLTDDYSLSDEVGAAVGRAVVEGLRR